MFACSASPSSGDALQRAGWRRVTKRVRNTRVLLILGLAAPLWITLGWLATNPVVGNHQELRIMVAEPQDYGLQAQRVAFAATDGIPLVAWWLPARAEPEEVHGTVILAHGGAGNRSHMLSRAAFLVRNAWNVLAVDLRMHGESGGEWMSPGYYEAQDLLGAATYTRDRGERGPIILLGHSSGAVASLHAAVQSADVAAVIADGAFISPEAMMRGVANVVANDPHASIWRKVGVRLAASRTLQVAVVLPMYALRTGHSLQLERASAQSAILGLGARPVLFIAGERDSVVPPENARRMYGAAPSPLKRLLIIPGAEHNNTYRVNAPLYEAEVLAFLHTVLAADTAARPNKRLKLAGATK